MSGFLTNIFPPKPTFSVDQIPDLDGQVVLITGGNTGIGKETAKVLLAQNAKVYVAGRNIQKVEEAIRDLKEETGKQAYALQLDLADLKSVKQAAEEFQTKETQLHVLFNNAGVMFPPIESLFTVPPMLLTTAVSTPGGRVRVINTSSMGHLMGNKYIDYDTLKDGPKRLKMGQKLYFQSKFGNIVYSNELNRRYGARGIVSISLHPGLLKTDLMRHSSKLERSLTSAMLYPAPMGALTQLYAGTMPNAAELGGKYMIPWARVGDARKETNDPKVGKELWAWLEAQVKDL